jgi:opine dehydrogenase
VSGIDGIIKLASIIHRTDYWRRGRTIEKLGINNLSTDELNHYVTEGVLGED